MIGRAISYTRAAKRAREILKDVDSTESLIKEVEKKSAGLQAKFGDLWDDFKTVIRMLKAWVKREYEAPWKLVTTVTAVLVYFIMPLDAIPDLLLGFGYIDDIAVFAWAVKRMRTQIDAFKAWELAQQQTPVTLEGEVVDTQVVAQSGSVHES